MRTPVATVTLAAAVLAFAGCDSREGSDRTAPAPLQGTWSLPFSLEWMQAPGIRYADVELYELTIKGDSAHARRSLAVSVCDGRGYCGPVCQTTMLATRGLVDGGRIVFEPASVVRSGPSEVGEAWLSAELVAPDSLRVRLVVDSGDPECAFEGESVLARTEGESAASRTGTAR